MRSPTLTIFLTGLLIAALMFVSGCSSAELRLRSDDANALSRIYAANSWQFRQSLLDVQVREAGAVEVIVEGDAFQKEPSKNGSILLPIALVRELPDYLKGTDLKRQEPVELQSYKVVGGLWCVTALVRLDVPQEQPPAEPQRGPNRIQLKVLLVSPEFSNELSLLVPVEQHSTGAELYVTLPQGARFQSLNVSEVNNPLGQDTKLTMLPTSLTGGALRAAGKLSQGSSTTWNFSGVSYTFNVTTRSLSIVLRVLLWLTLLSLFAAFLVWMKDRQRRVYMRPSFDKRMQRKDEGYNLRIKRANEFHDFHRQLIEKEASSSHLFINDFFVMSIEADLFHEYHEFQSIKGDLYEKLGVLSTDVHRALDSDLTKHFVTAKDQLTELAHRISYNLRPTDSESQELIAVRT